MLAKKDYIFIASLALLGLLITLLIFAPKQSGELVVIKVDNKVVHTMKLNKNDSYRYEDLSSHDLIYKNTIIVENGYVFIKDANCNDHTCMKLGKISRQGESLVCLPHLLTVSIISDNPSETKDSTVDGISQ